MVVTPGYPFVLPAFTVPWPVRVNPHVQSARAHGKEWARQMGMLSSPGTWTEDTFDSDDWPLFAALTHPNATEEHLHQVTLWDICLLALDDYFVTAFKQTGDLTGGRIFVERLRQFMPPEGAATTAPLNQVERGLADVWSRTAPAMPPRLRNKFPDYAMEFARGNVWELVNDIECHVPDPLEYFGMRRETAGTDLSTGLAVHTTGAQVPPEVFETQPMQTLVGAFADTVGIRNDVHSYRKEIEVERDVNNCVLVIKRFHRCGLQQAVDIAYDLYVARLSEFERTAARLPALFDEMRLSVDARVGVTRYVASLQDWMAGDNQWYRSTGRYTRSADAPADVPAGPTGLGTTSAHLVLR